MHSFGAYVVLWRKEFGWSNTVLAGAFALTRVESGLLGPIQGWATDRFGPRRVLLFGNTVFGFGFVSLAFVETIVQFYAASIVIAIGGSLGGFATVMVSIVHWFNRHRSKAVAISQMGFSLAGLAIPLLVLALTNFGWRLTSFASGVLILVLSNPLAILIRHKPETYDDVADGIEHPSVNTHLTGSDHLYPAFSAGEALRTRSFWFLCIGHALALLTVSTVFVQLPLQLLDRLDYSLTQAGLIVTLMTMCQMIGQISGGFLGDRFEKRMLCALCLLAHAGAMFLLAFVSHTSMAILFAVLNGLGWGIRAPLMVAMRADYFGPKSFGAIMGYSSLIVMMGMTAGPIITGLMADRLGDFRVGFTLVASLSALGAFFFYFAKQPEHPRRITN